MESRLKEFDDWHTKSKITDKNQYVSHPLFSVYFAHDDIYGVCQVEVDREASGHPYKTSRMIQAPQFSIS